MIRSQKAEENGGGTAGRQCSDLSDGSSLLVKWRRVLRGMGSLVGLDHAVALKPETPCPWRTCVVIMLVTWLTFMITFSQAPFIVWDDSSRVADFTYDTTPAQLAATDSLGEIVHVSFAQPTASGYRPLAQLQHHLGMRSVRGKKTMPLLWRFAASLVIALMAGSVFLVARRFLQTTWAAALMTGLLLCSTPLLTSSWVMLASTQALVPFIMCTGLLLYWARDAAESRRTRHLCATGLILVLFLGPWYREFTGIVPVLLILMEMARHRRPTWSMVLYGAAFLHAVFPTALVKLLFIHELPLATVFRLGSLGDQMQPLEASGGFAQLFHDLRWHASGHFLALFPPLLLVASLASFCLFPVFFRFLQRLGNRPNSDQAAASSGNVFAGGRAGFGLVIGYLLVLAITWMCEGHYHSFAALFLSLGVALLGIQRGQIFLATWFVLSFLPFLKVFTEQVHFLYALIPALIIIVASLEWIVRNFRDLPGRWRSAEVICILCLALVSADRLMNVRGSYRVVKDAYRGIQKVAEHCKSNLPKGSVVVTNVLHGDDIRYYADNHIRIFWTVTAGTPSPETRAVETISKLQALLDNTPPETPVCFLDVDQRFQAHKVNYHSHKYVRGQVVDMESLGQIHRTHVTYHFLDPLRHLIQRRYVHFLGPPDLENDFYSGHSLEPQGFTDEVHAEYKLYRVKRRK